MAPTHISATSGTLLSRASMPSHPWGPRAFLRWCLPFTSACSPPSRTCLQEFDLVSRLILSLPSPILAIGAIAERGRLGPILVFTFLWSTIVYNPLACMTWNSNGWSFAHGGLDFAGGTPVHISSGTAALAISLYLGKRTGYGTERLAYKPHNTTYVILGTVFLWFGWFGFNGGSALSANVRAASACVVTNLAASVGGITWMLWDYRLERKWSAVGFCSGAVSGLVAITPASGFVGSRKRFPGIWKSNADWKIRSPAQPPPFSSVSWPERSAILRHSSSSPLDTTIRSIFSPPTVLAVCSVT